MRGNGVTGSASGQSQSDSSVSIGDATTVGARPSLVLGPESVSEKLRNALMIVQSAGHPSEPIIDSHAPQGPEAIDAIKFRASDVDAVRRLIGQAIEQAERETPTPVQVEVNAIEMVDAGFRL